MAKRAAGRAVIYTRISDDRDGKGEGVERQRVACLALAEREGLQVVAELQDNSRSASAYSRKPRPAWRELLRMLEAGEAECVIAWAPDRLYRQVVDLEILIPIIEGVRAQVLTVISGRFDFSTSSGRMNARLSAAVAAHESEIKSERIRARFASDASKGRVSKGGLRAFGYSADGLEVVPAEAEVIREGMDRLLAGESLTAIARSWNARGVTTSTGGKWRMGTLKRVLTSWRAAGIREHLGEPVAEGEWPAIVDRDTLERVRAVLLDPERTVTVSKPRVSSLRGIILCGKCGERMITGSAGHDVRTYRCGRPPNHNGCGSLTVRAHAVEREVYARVAAVLEGDGLAKAMQRIAGGVAGQSSAAAQLVSARQRLEGLSEDFYVRGRVKQAEYERRRAELEAMIAGLESELAIPSSTLALKGLPRKAAEIEQALSEQPASTTHALLRLLISDITLQAGRPGVFDPERVAIRWLS
jgi:site-specific DNA recombinase